MSGNLVYTLHLWPPLGHAAHYTGTTPERRLAQRLTDHALGRGARLTQVQIERGGFWVLAQTQPGGRALERRLKQHGATRRCEVCKAAGAYQSGELTAPEALARAGWDRSNPVQRSLLLDIFGIPKPPEIPSADAPEAAAAEPAAVTAGQPSAAPRPEVPAPRAEPRQGWAWPGKPVTAGPELDPVVDALIERWRSPARQLAVPSADAQPQPEPVWRPACEPTRSDQGNRSRTGGKYMSFPEDSWVEVRYPLTSEQEHGDREAWPWLPGWVVSQCGPGEWEICVQAPELAIPDAEGEASYPVCFRDASELRPQAAEPEAGL